MKLFISSDIEGTAGIVDWQQVRASGTDYELGRRLLTDEVNAAIDGAVDAERRRSSSTTATRRCGTSARTSCTGTPPTFRAATSRCT
jgi:D-aminopeptidase